MFILFGCGKYSKYCVDFVGKDNVRYFIDNDAFKRNVVADIPVYLYAEKKEELLKTNDEILITVSYRFERDIVKQLLNDGIKNFIVFSKYHSDKIKENLSQRINYIHIYKKAIKWIKDNTVPNAGIVCHDMKNPYPEVSGYYIPTLLYWGERELAISYAKWLCFIQKEDGAWYDTYDELPFVFDTAQILKGLIAVREFLPEVDGHIIRGCDWLVSRMETSGRMTAVRDIWGDGHTFSELIHVYCLSPIKRAGIIYGKQEYVEAAERSLSYYLKNHMDEILHFHLLSHFYAYVIEGLLDMGCIDVAKRAMENLSVYQKEDGSVPGYNNVNWICSTGLFQFAVIWFRLGNIERGNKAFEYACKLQNRSGGWFGSYLHSDYLDESKGYIPYSEISWANKYFLDALKYKEIASFESWNPGEFWNSISKKDKKYLLIRNAVKQNCNENSSKSVLEVGSFRGRYLRNLLDEFPNNKYYAIDISEKILASLDDIPVEKKQGALTCIEYQDKMFDVVYACESLEHAIDIENSIREVARVLKPGGVMLFIDKNIETLGIFSLEDWEQWFDEKDVAKLMEKYCGKVEVIHNIEDRDDDKRDVFSGWIGIKN